MTTQLSSRPPVPRTSGAPHHRLLLTTGWVSLALTLLAVWFLLEPDRNPLADPRVVPARLVLGSTACTSVLAGIALLGAVVALASAHTSTRRPALLTAAAAVEVATLGLAFQSVSTIALAGYLLALALPVGLACLVVQVVRRYRRLRWPLLLAVAAVAVAGVQSDVLTPTHVVRLAAELGAGFASSAPMLLLVLGLAGSVASWVLVGVRLRPDPPTGRAGDSWIVRHRRGLTLVAAAGPLPYGLVRLSWLTPWPLLAPTEALPAETRMWGLLLGGSALLGSVLTVGLIRPWGVRFPRWMPGLAGRPVPVAVAAVPGGVVAGIVCASAVPMLLLTLAPGPGTVFAGLSLIERLAATLIFPFVLWGPALALAVRGYVGARRAGESVRAQ